jgi:hypothetical protein
MGRAGSGHGKMTYAYKIPVTKPEGKRQHARTNRRWEDNNTKISGKN